ncbi:hypothetical protein EON81_06580 [bacterium]|nr:MAG: hypothetical protein EON81_06580 [bacterium]
MLSHVVKGKWSTDEFGALDAGLLIALPLACTAFAGCAYHFVHQTFLVRTSIGPSGLVHSPYLTLVPAFAFCGWYGGRLGRNGLLATMVGGFIAIFATLNFRGSFYWPGTFEMSAFGLYHTLGPMLLGAVLGLFFARTKRGVPRYAKSLAGAVLTLALTWVWADASRDIGIESLSPYSLHFALLGTYAVAVASAVLVRFASE